MRGPWPGRSPLPPRFCYGRVAMRRLRLSAVVLAGLLGLLARAHARSAPPNPYPGYMSTTYADPAHWLCRPDLDDVCDHGLDATAVAPKGNFGRRARVGS